MDVTDSYDIKDNIFHIEKYIKKHMTVYVLMQLVFEFI